MPQKPSAILPSLSIKKALQTARGRYRCSRCEYTFHDFSGRWINRGRLNPVQWLSLIKHHGVSKKYFPLYLKELEFRYNNRNQDIFDQVANYLCDLVPKWD